MGVVIGHEMTHGFDDQGRQFDAKGNLSDWWTKSDADKYNAQAKCVVEQFDAYTVVDSTTHVNGKLTLGENIADLGGLKIAYLALEKSLKEHGRPAEDRRLHAGAAVLPRLGAGVAHAAERRGRQGAVNTDPHSPAKWRVNGPLSNMPEFKAAWGARTATRWCARTRSGRGSGSLVRSTATASPQDAEDAEETRGGLHRATNRMFLLKAARDATSWRHKPPRYE